MSNNMNAQEVNNGTIPRITEGPVVPEVAGIVAGSAKLQPTRIGGDDLPDSPEHAEIPSQHPDIRSDEMEPDKV